MAKALLGDALNGSQFFDSAASSIPLAGGKIYTYEIGTTTNKSTYKLSDLVTAHSNPIILDANGRPPSFAIWLSGETKLRVYDSNDVFLYDIIEANLDESVAGGGWALKEPNVRALSSQYTLQTSDDGKFLVATTGSWILFLLSSPVVGDGFLFDFYNEGTGLITIEGFGAETVNGLANITIPPATSAHFRADGSNWRAMTTGFLPMKSAARAARTVGYTQVAGAGIFEKIPLDTDSITWAFDEGGNYDAGSRWYLVPSDGIYQITGKVSSNISANTSLQAAIDVDGTLIQYGARSSTATAKIVVSTASLAAIKLVKDQQVELWGRTSDTGRTYDSGVLGCTLEIARIG